MSVFSRDRARDVFQHVLYGPLLSAARPAMVRLLRRAHNHVFNCSSEHRSNGEDWLVGQMPASGTFLDVGFNQGEWTSMVLARCPSAVVHGFDPCRDVLGVVDRLALPDSRFSFHPIALSNEPGTATFHDYGDLHGMNSLANRQYDLGRDARPNTYEVPVTTLDLWAADHGDPFVDVLKVDAEGFDLHILEGARGMLERQRVDMLVFEYASGWFASKRTLFEAHAYLTGLGYAVHRLFPHFLVPYRYNVEHEGTLIGYFVALSKKRDESDIPTRDLAL